ncbi:hypothetical protein CRE_03493 [Caenorhabditis remanei]|uniref:Uncharacterized protein n=1 Tax=Caenorhabditis remanei TaxID=31234 RepID=E3NJD8_CAERE|nr:hypothetical protein CRE_03493 [Caenorhabditis remanei]
MSSPKSVSEKLLDIIIKDAEKYVGTAGRRAIANAEEALSSILLGLQRDGKLSAFTVSVMGPIPKRGATSPVQISSAPPNKKPKSATGKENPKQTTKPKQEEKGPGGSWSTWKGLDLVVTPSRKPMVDPSDTRVIQVPVKLVKDKKNEQIRKLLRRTKTIIWVATKELSHAKEAVSLVTNTNAKKVVVLAPDATGEVEKVFADGEFKVEKSEKATEITISEIRAEFAKEAKEASVKSKDSDNKTPEIK